MLARAAAGAGCRRQPRILVRSSASRLGRRCFSSYDNCVVSEEQIQNWADEAEAGYDVAQLKRRGRGRPGRGAEPMQVVAVRLTVDELAALDAVAGRENVSRSEAIRSSLLASAERMRRRHQIAGEAAALDADDADRAEMLAVAALMESMRAAR